MRYPVCILVQRPWVVTISAISAAAMTLFVAGRADASVIYAASVSAVYGDGRRVDYGGTWGLTVPQHYELSGSTGFALADANDTNGGTASVDVASIFNLAGPSSTWITQIYATADVAYRFSISGTDTGMTIPVLLSAAGASTGGYDTLAIQDAFSFAYGQQGNFDVRQELNLVPGREYVMRLHADAATFLSQLGPGEIIERGATVDPTLTIQGPDAQLYHFIGLPDSVVGGSIAAVPEPASWAVMVSGFGILGGALRRQRKTPEATAQG